MMIIVNQQIFFQLFSNYLIINEIIFKKSAFLFGGFRKKLYISDIKQRG